MLQINNGSSTIYDFKMKKILEITASNPFEQPINCNTHDYLEIASLYAYELIIELKNNEIIRAKAKTTETKSSKIEYLVVESESTIFEIPMTEISRITTTSSSASFRVVDFE